MKIYDRALLLLLLLVHTLTDDNSCPIPPAYQTKIKSGTSPTMQAKYRCKPLRLPPRPLPPSPMSTPTSRISAVRPLLP